MGILYESVNPKIKKIVERYFEGEGLKDAIEKEKAKLEAEALLEVLKNKK